jgi:zinc and cadmium transporter
MILFYIVLATFLTSLISLLAVAFLSFKDEAFNKIIPYFVALSAGTMMGAAFLHLLPETAEVIGLEEMFIVVLFSFVCFFFLEKVIHWHHCHISGKHEHTLGHMSLVGDGFHNFIDGAIIAAAFVADVKLGILTTLAVALHEIPQEISDFFVLLYSGWKKSAAIKANLLVAGTMMIGGIAGYFLANQINGVIPYLMAFAAGGFIYISASDLMPELREEKSLAKSFAYLIMFITGILIMYFVD